MIVEYEQIQGRPTNLQPMPLTAIRQLTAGDKVYLWWAKDGNLEDVRVNEVCTIEAVTPFDESERWPHRVGVSLSVGGGDIAVLDADVQLRPDDNSLEWGGRGLAYFYHPPGN